MPALKLAVNLVPNTLFYGHLQIVYVDDQNNEKELEVQGELLEGYILAGEWDFEIEQNHALSSNYQEIGKYYITTLDLGDRTAEVVWDQLKQLNDQFVQLNPQIDYDLYKNSNSYVTTLLATVGIDVAEYSSQMIQGQIAETPGVGVNVLENVTDAIAIKLIGSDENDIFADGAKADTLYGGEGNDSFFLMDDDAMDLIVLGQGNDYVVGGGSEDRLVIASHLINTSGLPGLQDADTSSIPLLGGFTSFEGPNFYRYVPSVQQTIGGEIFIEIDRPETMPVTFVYDSGPSLWGEFSLFVQDTGYDAADNPIPQDRNETAFSIMYELNQTDLTIYFDYLNTSDEYVSNTITIADFEEGDYGIEFYDRAPAAHGPPYVADTAGVSHIHNGGDYIDWIGLA